MRAHMGRAMETTVRDDAVVHEGVAAEDERVVVHCRGGGGGGGGGADVRETEGRACVGADGAEVRVVQGGLGALVQGGAGAGARAEGAAGGGVPG